MQDSYTRVPLDTPSGMAQRGGSRAAAPAAQSSAVVQQPPHHPSQPAGTKVHAPAPKDKKDLTKGWKRYFKKIKAGVKNVIQSVENSVENCCGSLYDDGACAEPLTIETLEDAVRDPDAEQVERLLNAGVQVNAPIDEQGSTVLDALAIEFLQMLEDCEEYRLRGVGTEALTDMFIDHNRAFHEVSHLLEKNGAMMSGIIPKATTYIE